MDEKGSQQLQRTNFLFRKNNLYEFLYQSTR